MGSSSSNDWPVAMEAHTLLLWLGFKCLGLTSFGLRSNLAFGLGLELAFPYSTLSLPLLNQEHGIGLLDVLLGIF